MNEFCKLGLKIAAAIIAGGVVFIGLDKATSKKSSEQQPPADNEDSHLDGNNDCCCNNLQNNQSSQNNMNTGEKVVNCLKKTQETCNRAMSVIQNITIAADSIVRIFKGSGSPTPSYNYGNYYNNDTPPGFRRISPCILEYVGDSRRDW